MAREIYGHSRNTAATLGTRGYPEVSRPFVKLYLRARYLARCAHDPYIYFVFLPFSLPLTLPTLDCIQLAPILLQSKRLFTPLRDKGGKFERIADSISNKSVYLWKISRLRFPSDRMVMIVKFLSN